MIKFDDSPYATSRFIRENIKLLGTLKGITHRAGFSQVPYETTIEGDLKTMVVSGFASGFDGAEGLYELLIDLGIPSAMAKEQVFKKRKGKYEFSFDL